MAGMAFLAGLGQAAQNYQQAQQRAQAQQLAQLLFRKQQQEQQAKALEGDVLSSPGGIPGFGGGGGIGGGFGSLPGATPISSIVPQAAPPTPAMPPMSTSAATPTPDLRTDGDEANYPGGRIPGMDAPAPPAQTRSEAEWDRLRDQGVLQGPGGQLKAAGLASPSGITPAATPVPDSGASVPSEGGGGQGGGLSVTLPGGQSMDLGSLFQRVDPSAIAQRIKQLRPDAAPEAIAMATESLYKLAHSGNRSEQLATASLLKYLMPTANFSLGEQGRNARAALVSDDKAASRAVTTAGQQIRVDEGALNRESREGIAAAGRASREQMAADARAARAAQGSANREAAMARVVARLNSAADPAIKAQLATLRARRQAIADQAGGVGGANEAQRKQLEAVDNQIIGLAERAARQVQGQRDPGAAPDPQNVEQP